MAKGRPLVASFGNVIETAPLGGFGLPRWGVSQSRRASPCRRSPSRSYRLGCWRRWSMGSPASPRLQDFSTFRLAVVVPPDRHLVAEHHLLTIVSRNFTALRRVIPQRACDRAHCAGKRDGDQRISEPRL